jgi:hypothetical protein
VIQELQVQKEIQDLREFRDQLVLLVLQDHKEPQVQKEIQVQLEQMVVMEQMESQDHKDNKAQ